MVVLVNNFTVSCISAEAMTRVPFETAIERDGENRPLLETRQHGSGTSLNTAECILIEKAALCLNSNSDDSDKNDHKRGSSYLVDYANIQEFRRASTLRTSKNDHTNIPHLLYRMPNTGFGIPLGLGGQAILWKTLHNVKTFATLIDETPNRLFWILCLITAIMILCLYILKALKYPFLIRDEWEHPVRCHFFNGPHLIICMLSIGCPDGLVRADNSVIRFLFGVCLISQFTCTIPVYRRWLFDNEHSVSQARPQFFLSGVGWFLLTVMGQMCDIEGHWGVDIPSFCFGAGTVLYAVVVTCVFLASSQANHLQRSPAMFLFIAPPSVAAVAAMNFEGTFGQASRYIFGWCLLLLPLLLRMAHAIFDNVPSAFGVFWAYIFPLAGISTTAAKYADVENSMSSYLICFALTALSLVMLGLVLFANTYTTVQIMRKKVLFWGDPIVTANIDRFEPNY